MKVGMVGEAGRDAAGTLASDSRREWPDRVASCVILDSIKNSSSCDSLCQSFVHATVKKDYWYSSWSLSFQSLELGEFGLKERDVDEHALLGGLGPDVDASKLVRQARVERTEDLAHDEVDGRALEEAREDFVQRHVLLDERLHIRVRHTILATGNDRLPVYRLFKSVRVSVSKEVEQDASRRAHLQRLGVDLHAVAHDGDELGVNLILVLLVVALELVEFDEHDGLLWVEMAAERFADVRDERDHNRECLRSERCAKILRMNKRPN